MGLLCHNAQIDLWSRVAWKDCQVCRLLIDWTCIPALVLDLLVGRLVLVRYQPKGQLAAAVGLELCGFNFVFQGCSELPHDGLVFVPVC